jgi:hypothetical protein
VVSHGDLVSFMPWKSVSEKHHFHIISCYWSWLIFLGCCRAFLNLTYPYWRGPWMMKTSLKLHKVNHFWMFCVHIKCLDVSQDTMCYGFISDCPILNTSLDRPNDNE